MRRTFAPRPNRRIDARPDFRLFRDTMFAETERVSQAVWRVPSVRKARKQRPGVRAALGLQRGPPTPADTRAMSGQRSQPARRGWLLEPSAHVERRGSMEVSKRERRPQPTHNDERGRRRRRYRARAPARPRAVSVSVAGSGTDDVVATQVPELSSNPPEAGLMFTSVPKIPTLSPAGSFPKLPPPSMTVGGVNSVSKWVVPVSSTSAKSNVIPSPLKLNAVERAKYFRWNLERRRYKIFAEMCDRRCSRNQQEVARPPQEPGQRKLHRCDLERCCRGIEYRRLPSEILIHGLLSPQGSRVSPAGIPSGLPTNAPAHRNGHGWRRVDEAGLDGNSDDDVEGSASVLRH
jgi:hypothetical protein